MAPKKDKSPPSDPDGIFSGMVVFLIETGVQPRRLQVSTQWIIHDFSSNFPFFFLIVWYFFLWMQIWKQKLVQMGAKLEDRFTKNVTHVFATDANSLLQKLDKKRLIRSKAVSFINSYAL